MITAVQHVGDSLPGTVPIVGRSRSVIGTGAVVAPDLVLTALHVIDPEPTAALRVGDRPAAAAASLPLRRFGPAQHLARCSYQRARDLCGVDNGTVDLALLVVPALPTTPLRLRHAPIERDDYVVVAGYPTGRWSVTSGPVTSRDDADFVAHLMVGPGGSGSPALDPEGQLAGIATIDHGNAGTIFIGPELLTAFLDRTYLLIEGIGTSRRTRRRTKMR